MKYPKLRILLTALLILAMAVGVIHSVWAQPVQDGSASDVTEAVAEEPGEGLLAFSSVSPLTLVAGGGILFAVAALAIISKNRQE